MSQNDFGINTGNWEETNSYLSQAADSLEEACDEMKANVKDSLLQAGLVGDTSEALSETYDVQVLSSVRQFIAKLREFIGQNEANKSLADDLNASTMRVAQTININNIPKA